MFDLTGKRALVTGSTQGIGFAIAKCLAGHGAKVYVHGSRSAGLCKKAAQEIPFAEGISADLAKKGSAADLYEQTGGVDILVLNASVQYRRAWNEITETELETQLRVNLASSYELIRIYAGDMEKKGWGRILTVGSVQQYRPHKDMLIYAASKAAQMNMVMNLAKQLAPAGVTVNNLVPGVIATPRNEKALSDNEYKKEVIKGIPCGFAGKPEDCCGAALLLCSSEGRYITGSEITVDGGMKL